MTEGEHDEANTAGERNIINSEPPDSCELNVESGASSNVTRYSKHEEWHAVYIHDELRKETLLIEVRDHIEFTEVGATQP